MINNVKIGRSGLELTYDEQEPVGTEVQRDPRLQMKVEVKPVRQEGACNFCRRGKENGGSFRYPYEYVYLISGFGISVRMCRQCMEKFLILHTALDLSGDRKPEMPD